MKIQITRECQKMIHTDNLKYKKLFYSITCIVYTKKFGQSIIDFYLFGFFIKIKKNNNNLNEQIN